MPHPSARNNLVGILCAVSASVFFSFNDMAIKFLSGDYALHQIVLIRSTIGLIALLAIVVPLEGGYGNLRTKRLPLHLLRGVCVVFANMTFFLALAAMPLADAVAIFFVAPLIITLFSIIFLGETVGGWRWASLAIGMVGVVIMMRPSQDSFQLVALLPLAAAMGYAFLHILTRKMGGTERAGALTFYIQLTFIVVSALMGLAVGDGRFATASDPSLNFLLREWVYVKPGDAVIFLAIGLASTGGGYLISQAYRLAEAGLAAPFEYAAMPMAIFWGAVVFSKWPDRTTWVGVTLIVGAGLFMLWRETVAQKGLAGKSPTRLR